MEDLDRQQVWACRRNLKKAEEDAQNLYSYAIP